MKKLAIVAALAAVIGLGTVAPADATGWPCPGCRVAHGHR
jgi:hypothetical protein